MMIIRFSILTFICYLCTHTQGTSQNLPSDSLIRQASIASAAEHYINPLGKFFHLFSGIEHIDADRFIKGHAFCGEDEWIVGELFYDSILFKDIPMKYDLYNDVVVANLSFDKKFSAKFSLHNERVRYFNYGGRNFIMVNDFNFSKPQICELLYSGKVKALVRREKLINEWITDGELKREFVQKNFHFVFKDNAYHPVNTKSALLKLFKDKKKDIRKLLKQNRIVYRFQKDQAVVLATQYYDQQLSKK